MRVGEKISENEPKIKRPALWFYAESFQNFKVVFLGVPKSA